MTLYLKINVPYFYDLPGEYTVQHNQQLGQPRQRGAQLPVLRKNFSLEGCSGETHKEAPQGAIKDVKS